MANNRIEKDSENKSDLSTNPQRRCFEIQVKGQLDESWSDWLGGLEVRLVDNGEMVLSGYIVDQAALMGILNKIYSLNLTILSVSEIRK
jgi:hypothetical protein